MSSPAKREQLSRYIIAYDGDVATAVDEKTTYVVCEDEAMKVCVCVCVYTCVDEVD